MTVKLDENLDRLMTLLTRPPLSVNNSLQIQFDDDWPSPCYREIKQPGEWVDWLPVRQSGDNVFTNVENALGIELHASYKAYFTRYYSDHIHIEAKQGQCTLLQVWNDEDFARLQQNLIGHLLMKQRLKQTPTLFFATTTDDDILLSVDNATGEVVTEPVGKEPIAVIASNLAEFIGSCLDTRAC